MALSGSFSSEFSAKSRQMSPVKTVEPKVLRHPQVILLAVKNISTDGNGYRIAIKHPAGVRPIAGCESLEGLEF